jgi:tRNA(adenine34) deaminase
MEKYMNIAIKLAKKAYKKGEIPVGAVIVKNNKIISKAYNMKEQKKDCTKHAEILAIQKASKKLKNWRLIDCEIYITMEPCMMCAGAIEQARISKIIYAVDNPTFGCTKNIKNIEIINGICEKECKNLVQEFFKKKRI